MRAQRRPWVVWPTDSSHGRAAAFHFRTIEDAARFYAAFAMFELADGMAPEQG